MEQGYSKNRVGFQFGKAIEGAEKAFIKLAVNLGKPAADLQIEKLKPLLGTANPKYSIVVVLTPAPGKQDQLEELLTRVFEGQEEKNGISDEIYRFKKGPHVPFTVMKSGTKVVIHIDTAGVVPILLAMFLGYGAEEIPATEQASINLNILSGIDFHDLLGLHEQGYSSLSAFLTSFLVELTSKSAPDSKLEKIILRAMQSFSPGLPSSPFPLLGALLQTVDVDFAFKSAEELPANIREAFCFDPALKYLPRTDKKVQESQEAKFLNKLKEVLSANIEVYATVEKVAAIHLEISAPGFGVALTTLKPGQEEISKVQ